jgi:hypothetical protein
MNQPLSLILSETMLSPVLNEYGRRADVFQDTTSVSRLAGSNELHMSVQMPTPSGSAGNSSVVLHSPDPQPALVQHIWAHT